MIFHLVCLRLYDCISFPHCYDDYFIGKVQIFQINKPTPFCTKFSILQESLKCQLGIYCTYIYLLKVNDFQNVPYRTRLLYIQILIINTYILT